MMVKNYRKKSVQPMQPWVEDSNMNGISVSDKDKARGCPRDGDMIAHNPASPKDRWLVSREFFDANYEEA